MNQVRYVFIWEKGRGFRGEGHPKKMMDLEHWSSRFHDLTLLSFSFLPFFLHFYVLQWHVIISDSSWSLLTVSWCWCDFGLQNRACTCFSYFTMVMTLMMFRPCDPFHWLTLWAGSFDISTCSARCFKFKDFQRRFLVRMICDPNQCHYFCLDLMLFLEHIFNLNWGLKIIRFEIIDSCCWK